MANIIRYHSLANLNRRSPPTNFSRKKIMAYWLFQSNPKYYKRREQGTGNREQGTLNWEQGTGNS
ncbi:MAG: hypothetical protein HEQ13_02480 [Dolichospermum sp. DEX189]|nr:hypothetical protein [Dolichospermum sp. DEX189]